jgi:hypothetical protein
MGTPGQKAKAVGIICLAILFLSSCLVRRRVVKPAGARSTRPLQVATKQQLIERVHSVSDPIRSFRAKVGMAPSVGELYGGKVTDYASLTGFILFEQSDCIRVMGLDPVIHSTVFDMVSVGNDFRVSISLKSLFLEGKNDAPATSSNKLENLRSIAFLTSLVIRPPDPQKEFTFLEDDTDETKAVYILFIAKRGGDEPHLTRGLYFDRTTLQIVRQKTFDAAGHTTSLTRYSDWKITDGVQYPSVIDIQRPQEGYEVVLTITDMKINTPDVTADKFVLNPPLGAHVRELK